MSKAGLFDKWTMQGLLDNLDTIELLKAPDHGRLIGEATETQKKVFAPYKKSA